MFYPTISQLIVIAGLIFIFAELLVGIEAGFDLVVIGSILVLSGFLGTATNTTIALIAAIILALVYVFYGRTFVKKKVIIATHKTNIDKLIGKKAIVIRSITPDTTGIVRTNDEDWRATSTETLFEKDKVIIESIEGVTLHVKKTTK